MQQLLFLCALFALPAAATTRYQLKNGDIISAECQQLQQELHCQHAILGSIVIPLADVQLLDSNRAVEHKVPTTIKHAPTPWHLEVDISASKRHGSQVSDSLLFNTHARYQRETWRYSLDADYDFENKQGSRKTHKYQLSPAIDYFIEPQLFVRSQLQYQYDFLASDYQNLDLSSGPGWRWWYKNDDNYAETMASVGVKKAWFHPDDAMYRGLFAQDAPLTYQFVALDWDLRRELSTTISLFAKGRYLQITAQPTSLLDFNAELEHEMGIRYHLTEQVRLSYSIWYQRTDLTLQLPNIDSIGLSIAQTHQLLAIGAEF